MPAALAGLLARARAEVLVVSYNDESWISPEQMTGPCARPGTPCVEVVAFDSKRYVGAQIGVHGPTGEKVGEVKRLRNVEYVFLAGERERVQAAAAAVATRRAGSRPPMTQIGRNRPIDASPLHGPRSWNPVSVQAAALEPDRLNNVARLALSR